MSYSQPLYSNLEIIPVFDWFLCFDREVRLVWNRRPGVTGASPVVYVFSRYAILVQSIVNLGTNVPMSDKLCGSSADPGRHWGTGNGFTCSGLNFGVFFILRVSVLSNGNRLLIIVTILFGLPGPLMIPVYSFLRKMQGIGSGDFMPMNLPAPFNQCLSVVPHFQQYIGLLLVVVITWRHTYQSTHRLSKFGIEVGISQTISSILIYNGSIYLLFLLALYIIDIIVSTNSLESFAAGRLLVIFHDPLTSVILCHFMLSLREFDSAVAESATYSMHGSPVEMQELIASTTHPFAGEPGGSRSLPAFVSSFAQPVHLDSDPSTSGHAALDSKAIADMHGLAAAWDDVILGEPVRRFLNRIRLGAELEYPT
ncbi:hypothetical protein V8D89_003840 [Ganoderma adspersum]